MKRSTTQIHAMAQRAFEASPPSADINERSVIGALLVDPSCVNHAIQIIPGAEAFTSPALAAIYDTILALARTGRAFDVTAVAGELKRKNILDQLGGIDELITLHELVPSGAMLEHHALAVVEAWKRLRVVDTAGRVMNSVVHGGASSAVAANRLIDEASRLVSDGDMEIQAFADTSLPPYPLDALPDFAARFCSELAPAKEVSLDFIIPLAFGIMSACVARKFCLELEHGHTEPLVVQAISCLATGNRKSSTLDALSSPLKELQTERMEQVAKDARRNRIKRDILDGKRKEKLARAHKEEDVSEQAALIDEALTFEEEMEKIPNAKSGQLISANYTEPALVDVLEQNGGQTLILSSEGKGFFDCLGGRYADGAVETGLILQGYDAEAYSSNRVGRGYKHLPRPLVCVAVTPQTDTLIDVKNKKSMLDTGVFARFLWSFPESSRGSRTFDAAPISEDAWRSWRGRIGDMARASLAWSDEPIRVRLNAEAYALYLRYSQVDLEGRLAPGREFGSGGMVGSASKIANAACRWAAICAAFESSASAGVAPIVTASHMTSALAMAEVALSHAANAYEVLGSTARSKASAAVTHYSSPGNRWPGRVMSDYDWWRDLRKIVEGTTVKDWEPIADELAARGYLIAASAPSGATGRAAGARYWRANNRLRKGDAS